MKQKISTNEQLKVLVKASGLKKYVARLVFNRGLGARAISESTWKSFFVKTSSDRYRDLKPELLLHAEIEFAKWATESSPLAIEELKEKAKALS